MRSKITHRFLATAVIAAMTVAPTEAKSSTIPTDLIGARAGQAEGQLEARGYTHITTQEGKHNILHSYWWNARDKHCIQVDTSDGRYAAILDATKGDCNQGGSGDAAVAVGAVATVALLGALMSHKSHHHDDNQHLASDANDQQYERGYNDGLYNTPYHNYDRSDQYAQGYSAGVDQHGRNTSHHSGKSGYAAHTSVADLKGMDAVRAIDAMSDRGFTNVDSFSSGDTLYGIYWKASTGQCVQMTNADNRVYDIRDIGTNPKCR